MRQTGKDSDGISRKLGHMCVSSEIAKYVGAWCVVAGGVVQIASSLAAVPPAIFDFQRFYSFGLATWCVTFASTSSDLMPHRILVAL
jgi:hypothetical protein